METGIQVEKGIPIPPRRSSRGGLVATLRAMEVGESFEFGGPKAITDATSIRHAAKKAGVKMTIRVIEGDRYRAWRVE